MLESEGAESELLEEEGLIESSEPIEIVTPQGFCIKVPAGYDPVELKRLLKLLTEL